MTITLFCFLDFQEIRKLLMKDTVPNDGPPCLRDN